MGKYLYNFYYNKRIATSSNKIYMVESEKNDYKTC